MKDACPEKFNQCLIINGCLKAKVVPHNNEWVHNNDGLVLNDVEQVPNNDGQVPNDKTQCSIRMSLCLLITKQA